MHESKTGRMNRNRDGKQYIKEKGRKSESERMETLMNAVRKE